MDITHHFKASVMAVKLQRKSELPQQDKNRILQKMKRDEFSKQAKDACNKITTLRNVLLENRSAYMRIGQHLKNASQMTDEQRDLIDRESEKFVNFYTQHLAQMQADWKKTKRKPQQQKHMECVFELLGNYLRSVYQIFLEQKKYRVQHELETYRLLKLASDKQKIPVRPAGECNGKKRVLKSRNRDTIAEEDDTEEDERSNAESTNSSDMDWNDWDDDWQQNEETIGLKSQHIDSQRSKRQQQRQPRNLDKLDAASVSDIKSQSQTSQEVALDEDIQKSQQTFDEEAKKLDPKDVQMFEEENMQLYHELQGLSEEVEQIEKNVVDIAQLQDIFTEKVSQT